MLRGDQLAYIRAPDMVVALPFSLRRLAGVHKRAVRLRPHKGALVLPHSIHDKRGVQMGFVVWMVLVLAGVYRRFKIHSGPPTTVEPACGVTIIDSWKFVDF